MSRIIKADMARFLPRDKDEPAVETIKSSDETESQEQEGFDIEQSGVSQSDLQAAYDELIAVAQDEVALLLEDARVEAQRILDSAQREAESMKSESERQGYQEGMSKAERETMQILEKAQRDVDSLIQETETARQRKIDEVEPALMKLSLDIAEKVLHYELDRNDEAFMSILTHALEQIKDDKQITLKVNTAEYSRYFNSRDIAKIKTANADIVAHVVEDSSVASGGCLIENESGVIDTSVSAQLGQVSHALGLDE